MWHSVPECQILRRSEYIASCGILRYHHAAPTTPCAAQCPDCRAQTHASKCVLCVPHWHTGHGLAHGRWKCLHLLQQPTPRVHVQGPTTFPASLTFAVLCQFVLCFFACFPSFSSFCCARGCGSNQHVLSPRCNEVSSMAAPSCPPVHGSSKQFIG